MKESDVRARAFAMPLTSPAYPVGPYRFVNREFLIITYRTDPQKLRELVPEPLQIEEPLVKFEFIRMPDSTGFGDYTESGQVRSVRPFWSSRPLNLPAWWRSAPDPRAAAFCPPSSL
jgi:acetoacetate decarboxylase